MRETTSIQRGLVNNDDVCLLMHYVHAPRITEPIHLLSLLLLWHQYNQHHLHSLIHLTTMALGKLPFHRSFHLDLGRRDNLLSTSALFFGGVGEPRNIIIVIIRWTLLVKEDSRPRVYSMYSRCMPLHAGPCGVCVSFVSDKRKMACPLWTQHLLTQHTYVLFHHRISKKSWEREWENMLWIVKVHTCLPSCKAMDLNLIERKA